MYFLPLVLSMSALAGDPGPGADQRRDPVSRHQHRYQHADVSEPRPGSGLSRLLRSSREFELLLLRRPVLGLLEGRLVREQLVQRSVAAVGPESVPLYVLRVPVRYYRRPPTYFHGWAANAPPRWGDHWGRGWEEQRSGWNQWDHRAVPGPAPLPVYQRQYSGSRYPSAADQQHAIRSEKYRYNPREPVTQQHYSAHGSERRRAAGQGAREERFAEGQRKEAQERRRRQGSPLGGRRRPPAGRAALLSPGPP